MKWRNAIDFWVFLIQAMRGVQNWFVNTHQRPWSHESHSTMTRFQKLVVLLCSGFLKVSVLGSKFRKFCIFQTARPLRMFNYVGAIG